MPTCRYTKMKKFLSILLLLIVALIVWFCLIKQTAKKPPTPEQVRETMPPLETNSVSVISNTSDIQIASQQTNAIDLVMPLTNALTATNLEQWKMAIKGLKPLAGFKFKQHWLVEQPGRTNAVPIVLSFGNKTIQYSAVLISILAKNDTGDIMEVEMQTPNMNIDEIRKLGIQFCDMFGLNSSDFLAWCDKVGNHWLDAPLYGSQDIHVPNSNTVFAFQTLRTYNNEKPWFINFMIMPNP